MSVASTRSGHWTDEQLIDHLYGLGPEDGHLQTCLPCTDKLARMAARRDGAVVDESVTSDFMAAQRRAIYAKIEQPVRWWQMVSARRWAPSAALLAVLAAGGATFYERHQHELAESRADAQLAQEVSNMAFQSESSATAPLRGLFIE